MNTTFAKGLPRAAVLAAAAFLFPGAAGAFDIADYFPLDSGSWWHYIGDVNNGGSPEDNFRWEVLDTGYDVGGGVTATRIKTTTDEATDSRNLDEDFWVLAGNGDLFYYGYHNGQPDDLFSGATKVGTVPVQDIVATDPVLAGRAGLTIGETVTDTGAASVRIQPIFGAPQTVPVTLTSEVLYAEFRPTYETPLMTFTNVLHLVVAIRASGAVSTPLGPVSFDVDVRNNEIFLVENVGMIAQDQEPDPNDAQIQFIDGGEVGGVPILQIADVKDWMMY